MDLHTLRVFRTVAAEKSFSRAASRLSRSQPAISLSVQKLERAIGGALIDRTGRALRLTDMGELLLDYARRFENLEGELRTAVAELREPSSGILSIGANESTTLYLLPHLARYRKRYPRLKVLVRRCLSSKIPSQIIDGDFELGIISYTPEDARLASRVIYTDHLAFVVSPRHRLAKRKSVCIADLGREVFMAHNVSSPYREVVVRAFSRRKVPLRREVELPTLEAIRKMVQRNEGVAFLPRMCVDEEIEQGSLCEVEVTDLRVVRKILLVYPARRTLSHAAKAFLALV